MVSVLSKALSEIYRFQNKLIRGCKDFIPLTKTASVSQFQEIQVAFLVHQQQLHIFQLVPTALQEAVVGLLDASALVPSTSEAIQEMVPMLRPTPEMLLDVDAN